MSVFILKLIAMITMLIDHGSFFVFTKFGMDYDLYIALRAVGRMSFPIFCFLLVNGFDKSSDRLRYLSRLISFAAISQFGYSLTFAVRNYSLSAGTSFSMAQPWFVGLLVIIIASTVWYCTVRQDWSAVTLALALILGLARLELFGVCLFYRQANVFYTLAIALAAMMLLQRWSSSPPSPALIAQSAAFLLCAICILPHSDYSYYGLLLTLLLYATRRDKRLLALALLFWCFIQYRVVASDWRYFAGAIVSVPLCYSYTGQHGRALKSAFYIAYPLHLCILGALALSL